MARPMELRKAELSGGSYARQAIAVTGSFLDVTPLVTSAFGAASAPAGTFIASASIFDAATGGNELLHLSLGANFRTWTLSTAAFPAMTLNFQFPALGPSENIWTARIDQGSQVGTVNGNPMVAASRLYLAAGTIMAYVGNALN
jgi:hypothetical protein